ncbi:hypothetical protein GCM10010319_64110 [Streptomyces blastmyceticus]|uniref:Uncharacterized protein n=1 Tax=Streptomyces blastmyceticus TaxID=68180 RepID=A0ABP3HS40_9ACTN
MEWEPCSVLNAPDLLCFLLPHGQDTNRAIVRAIWTIAFREKALTWPYVRFATLKNALPYRGKAVHTAHFLPAGTDRGVDHGRPKTDLQGARADGPEVVHAAFMAA